MSYFHTNSEKSGQAFCDGPAEREVSRGSCLEGGSEEKICLRGKKKKEGKETDGCGIQHHSHLLSCYELGDSVRALCPGQGCWLY